jgi:hypothetical protein
MTENSAIAEVDANGLVTAVENGNTTISLVTMDGI